MKWPGKGVFRKAVHILVGNIVFIWWAFDSSLIMSFLAAAPFALLLLLISPISPVRVLDGSLLEEASAEGHSYGLVFYAVSWSVLALVLFNDRLAASIAIAAMAYGDGIGGLVGKRYGRRRSWREKSWAGTGAVALVTFLATLVVIAFYTQLGSLRQGLNVFPYTIAQAFGLAALSGGFVAFVEMLSPGAYDNLIVPLLTAGLVVTVQFMLSGGLW